MLTPDEIRSRREAAEMTTEDLGKALGISGRTVERWESGAIVPKNRDIIALDVVLSEQVGAKSSPAPRRKALKR